jgi:hypothetical protein
VVAFVRTTRVGCVRQSEFACFYARWALNVRVASRHAKLVTKGGIADTRIIRIGLNKGRILNQALATHAKFQEQLQAA